MKRIIGSLACLFLCLGVYAADPTATHYSVTQCEGSLTPYPSAISAVTAPDSLEAVMINHVGRHGSRYPASGSNCYKLARALATADSLGTITPLGRKLMTLNLDVINRSNGQWGALDSLGMAEQRGLAQRMYETFPTVFKDAKVSALSSYSPRSMMSMFSFVHQLDRLDNKLEIRTSTGRNNSYLMRPFDVDKDYLDFRRDNLWKPAYDAYFEQVCPTAAITRVLGKDFPFENAAHWRDLAITEYYVLAGLSCMSVSADISEYLTSDELNALWSCFNLRQYLQRTATTVSTVPADIAADLVLNLIETTDNFIEGTDLTAVHLRFGHAETVMPLVSLLKLPGCYYMTNYFDTVALHWRDFDVVPMAANVRMILFKAKKSGRYYLRVDLNEKPVNLIPNNEAVYLPWGMARDYMMRCVPLYAQ